MTKKDDMGTESQINEEQTSLREALMGGSDDVIDPEKDSEKSKDNNAKEKKSESAKTDHEEDDSKKKEKVDEDNSKKTEKKDNKDSKKDGVDKSTFKDLLEKETPTKAPASEKYPPLTEDDFKIDDEGKVEISPTATHLIEDIEAMQQDMGLLIRIFKAKPEKGDVIAKAYGWKDTDIRSAGRAATDAIKAYLAAEKAGDEEKMQRIVDTEFPDELKYEDIEANYSIANSSKKDQSPENTEKESKGKGDDKLAPGIPYKKSEILDAVDRFVDRNFNKDDREAAKKKIMESTDLSESLAKPRFNPETGEKLSAYEHFEIVAEKMFENGEKLSTGRKAQFGGGKTKTADASKNLQLEGGEEQASLRNALMGVKI